MSRAINYKLEQIEIDDMPSANITEKYLREQHDPDTAFAPSKAPNDADEFEYGPKNKSAVTNLNLVLMAFIDGMLRFAAENLGWTHITLVTTVLQKIKGRGMHGFTRLTVSGHGITDAQLNLLNSLQYRVMQSIYPSGHVIEYENLLQAMGVSKLIFKEIEKELNKRAFNFLMKYGDRHLSVPICVVQPDGEVLLNQKFLPLPYRPEKHVSEQVTVIAKGIEVDPDTVKLALKTAGAHLEEKYNVVPEYSIGSQQSALIEALRSQEPFIVTLHTIMYSDGTNSGWVVDSIDAYPQTDFLPGENNH